MAEQMERKSLDTPDDLRPFKDGKGRAEIVTVGGLTLGRGTFEPGWRWSEHVKPIAGTHSCQAAHTGYVLEGRWNRNGIRPRRCVLHAVWARCLDSRRQALCAD
jgi:hypothetical protein